MAGHTNLAGEDHVLPESCASRKPGLGAEQCVLPDIGRVADLDEIVDLDAFAHAGFTNRSTVDGSVGPELHVIFKDNNAGLNDFVIASVFLLGISEAVGADSCPVLQCDVVADLRELAHRNMGIGLEVVPDSHTASDVDERIEDTAVTDLDIVFNDYKGRDRRISADLRAGGDASGAIEAGRRSWGRVEKFHGARECKIRIRRAERGYRQRREVLSDNDGGSLGGARPGSVPGIGNEGEMPGACHINADHGSNVNLTISHEGAIQLFRNFPKFQTRLLSSAPVAAENVNVTLIAVMSEHRSLLKSTSTISSLTILSRVFGYFREQRIAYLLGTGDTADAYNIAYAIPNLLRRLVGEGAVSAAFIPTFTRYLTDKGKEEAFEFANTLLAALTLLLLILTIGGIVFSGHIVTFVAEGFDNAAKFEATTRLNRIMFPYLAFVSLSALAMGVLNSFHKFAAPAFAPVLLNVSVISFSFFAGLFSEPAIALAIGVVAGGVLQLAIQIPSLLKLGWKMRWIWNLSHPGVRRVVKLMGPLLFGVGIVQVNLVVGWRFASRMEEGAVASITYADRIMELVLGGYAIALATAILPLLSRQATERRIDEMRNSLNFAVRVILFVTLPATVGLIVLRVPIIQVLFEHGQFDPRSTGQTAWPLLFFALGLSAFAVMKIIVPAFYALQDTRTPVLVALLAMFVNIALNFLFFDLLANGGPPLANSASAAFSTVLLTGIFRRRYGPIGVKEILKSVARFAVASAVLGLVCYAALVLPGFYAGGLPQRIAALVTIIAAAMVAYFGTARLLRTRELSEIGGMFSRRRA